MQKETDSVYTLQKYHKTTRVRYLHYQQSAILATDTNSCPKIVVINKRRNGFQQCCNKVHFIRPADKTMRTVNPVRYFANRTWHACDVTSNQRPSSHITGSPVRSSQFANYQTPVLCPRKSWAVFRRSAMPPKYWD